MAFPDFTGTPEILIADGAMGTLLQSRGLQGGVAPETWNVERPEDVLWVFRSYAEAGSRLIKTNSFGGTRFKLRRFGLEGRVRELSRAAAELGRKAAGAGAYVLGDMGPTGELLEPYGDVTEEEAYEAYKEQALALEEGGADAALVETMSSVEEIAAAIRAVRENTSLPVVASMTFSPRKSGGFATMMGVSPAAFVEAALEAGAAVVGSNCGIGPDAMAGIVKELKAAAAGRAPILAMPNAGLPELRGTETVFPETPESMAGKMKAVRDAGALWLGGCCGTTPAHIAAIARELA